MKWSLEIVLVFNKLYCLSSLANIFVFCAVCLQKMKEKSADVIEKPTGVLLYSLASSNVKEDWQIKLVTEYIADKKLASSIQLTGKVHASWSKVFEGVNWDISCSISVPSVTLSKETAPLIKDTEVPDKHNTIYSSLC